MLKNLKDKYQELKKKCRLQLSILKNKCFLFNKQAIKV